MRILFAHDRFGAQSDAETNLRQTARELQIREHTVAWLHGTGTGRGEDSWREIFSRRFPLCGGAPEIATEVALATFHPDLVYAHIPTTQPSNMKTNPLLRLSSVRLALAAVALGTSVLSSGCVAVVAGAGAGAAVAYSMGKLDTTVAAELDRTAQATRTAVTQLKFAMISESKDALSAEFVVRTAQDKKVNIRLARVGDRTTRLEIRVGVFGERTTSMALYDKISATL